MNRYLCLQVLSLNLRTQKKFLPESGYLPGALDEKCSLRWQYAKVFRGGWNFTWDGQVGPGHPPWEVGKGSRGG